MRLTKQRATYALLVSTCCWLVWLLARPTAAASSYTVYLPALHYAETLQDVPELHIQVTPDDILTASTYAAHAFRITAAAENTVLLEQLCLRLDTAVLPDLVFDPDGLAGDLVAKDVWIDSGSAHYAGRVFVQPHDDGYDQLCIWLNNFGPGAQMSFSVDVDPTSIRGVAAPGPFESGSISGLEMMGSQVYAQWAGGQVSMGYLHGIPGSVSGAELRLRADLPSAPQIALLDVAETPATVNQAAQTVRVMAQPNRPVALMLLESGLFTEGVPGGGYELEPYESNSVYGVVRLTAVTDASGRADIPITLTKTHPLGGINTIIVTQENSFGYSSGPSLPLVVQYTP